MLTPGNQVTSRMVIDLRSGAGYLRDISPFRGISLARKILLADDSVTAQNMGRKILADAGYEVIAVNNGSAALKKIAELKPDLVILDVYMPGYSGLEVCQRLKDSQETNRIPVLLSVGKLEPFNPEEAQRVRADGFIVKPFEASELLSALSKLEDKVVPRTEPSKPGRFARAIAAAEEAGRGGRSQPATEESGWKARIGFPHTKADAEEKVADEATVYNQMNRDLRTVVDKSPVEGGTPRAENSGAETVAAPSANILNDVTPEEVAAIAAAVARLHMTPVTGDGEDSDRRKGSQTQPSGADSQAASAVDFSVGAPPFAVLQGPDEATIPPRNESTIDNAANPSAAAAATSAEAENDMPATMAAGAASELGANAGASRWTAVSIALDSSEEASSLEQEMRQAYAAIAAPESEPTIAVTTAVAEPEPESVGHNRAEHASTEDASTKEEVSAAQASITAPSSEAHSFSATEAVAESSVGLAVVPDSQPVATVLEQTGIASITSEFADHAAVPAAADLARTPDPLRLPEPDGEPVESITQAVDTSTPTSGIEAHSLPTETQFVRVSEAVVSNQVPEPVAPSVVELSRAAEVTVAAQTIEVPLAPEAESLIAQAAAASFSGYAPTGYAQIVHRAEHEADPKPDSEVVKSTAAAWASWRQIRDTSDAKPDSATAEAAPPEPDLPAHFAAEPAAMAAAASAETAPELSATLPPENPADVASIVDSVLADLRPRLMAEISRKMSEKK